MSLVTSPSISSVSLVPGGGKNLTAITLPCREGPLTLASGVRDTMEEAVGCGHWLTVPGAQDTHSALLFPDVTQAPNSHFLF